MRTILNKFIARLVVARTVLAHQSFLVGCQPFRLFHQLLVLPHAQEFGQRIERGSDR